MHHLSGTFLKWHYWLLGAAAFTPTLCMLDLRSEGTQYERWQTKSYRHQFLEFSLDCHDLGA
jgi:hypothetical protein